MKALSAPFINIRKPFFLRREIDRLLFSSMFFGCTLVAIRIAHTGSHMFIYMIWNLFLAYIPYALSNWLTARYSSLSQPSLSAPLLPGARRQGFGSLPLSEKILFSMLSTIWLLFVPNSFYILTDLFHLNDGSGHQRVPQWFDLVLILTFAWNGLLLGIISVRQMEKLFFAGRPSMNTYFFVYPVMLLNSLGVFVGRYPRYNSWDIISDPIKLVLYITRMVIHPFQHQYAWNMIFCYSILLTLIYRMMRGGSKVLA